MAKDYETKVHNPLMLKEETEVYDMARNLSVEYAELQGIDKMRIVNLWLPFHSLHVSIECEIDNRYESLHYFVYINTNFFRFQ